MLQTSCMRCAVRQSKSSGSGSTCWRHLIASHSIALDCPVEEARKALAQVHPCKTGGGSNCKTCQTPWNRKVAWPGVGKPLGKWQGLESQVPVNRSTCGVDAELVS